MMWTISPSTYFTIIAVGRNFLSHYYRRKQYSSRCKFKIVGHRRKCATRIIALKRCYSHDTVYMGMSATLWYTHIAHFFLCVTFSVSHLVAYSICYKALWKPENLTHRKPETVGMRKQDSNTYWWPVRKEGEGFGGSNHWNHWNHGDLVDMCTNWPIGIWLTLGQSYLDFFIPRLLWVFAIFWRLPNYY